MRALVRYSSISARVLQGDMRKFAHGRAVHRYQTPENTGASATRKIKEDQMFAVLKTGGKQYKVASGDVLRVEKLAAKAGDKVQFNEILMVGSTVGAPLVEGAGVQAEVIDQIKGEKTINFVKRRRKHGSQRTKGHRQQLTLVRIAEILEKGADKSGVMAAVSGAGVTAEPAAKPVAKKEAPKKAAAGGADDLKALSGVGPALE